jgi:hypothetical protein
MQDNISTNSRNSARAGGRWLIRPVYGWIKRYYMDFPTHSVFQDNVASLHEWLCVSKYIIYYNMMRANPAWADCCRAVYPGSSPILIRCYCDYRDIIRVCRLPFLAGTYNIREWRKSRVLFPPRVPDQGGGAGAGQENPVLDRDFRACVLLAGCCRAGWGSEIPGFQFTASPG